MLSQERKDSYRLTAGCRNLTTEFALDGLVPGSRVERDLGRVEVIAAVRLNHKPAGTLWAAPYRLDITW